jgi:hypothetical protein
MRWDPVAD